MDDSLFATEDKDAEGRSIVQIAERRIGLSEGVHVTWHVMGFVGGPQSFETVKEAMEYAHGRIQEYLKKKPDDFQISVKFLWCPASIEGSAELTKLFDGAKKKSQETIH